MSSHARWVCHIVLLAVVDLVTSSLAVGAYALPTLLQGQEPLVALLQSPVVGCTYAIFLGWPALLVAPLVLLVLLDRVPHVGAVLPAAALGSLAALAWYRALVGPLAPGGVAVIGCLMLVGCSAGAALVRPDGRRAAR